MDYSSLMSSLIVSWNQIVRRVFNCYADPDSRDPVSAIGWVHSGQLDMRFEVCR